MNFISVVSDHNFASSALDDGSAIYFTGFCRKKTRGLYQWRCRVWSEGLRVETRNLRLRAERKETEIETRET